MRPCSSARHRDRRAQAEIPPREVDRAVALLPHDEPHRWTAGHAVGLDVPSDPAQHVVARGCHARELRHRRARGEPDLALGGQAEQVEEPRSRDLLRGDRARGDGVQAAVLVPCRHQPVGRERHRLRSADHPAEEAGRPDRHQSGFRGLGEAVDDLDVGFAVVWQHSAEPIHDLIARHARRDRALADAREPLARVAPRDIEHLVVRRRASAHRAVVWVGHVTPGFRAPLAPSDCAPRHHRRSTSSRRALRRWMPRPRASP